MSAETYTDAHEPALSDVGLFIVLALTFASMGVLAFGILYGDVFVAMAVIALAASALLILVVGWLREGQVDASAPRPQPRPVPQGRLHRFVSKGLVWAIFVVGAAFVPFVFRYIYRPLFLGDPTPWSTIFDQKDLVIIILAVAAGAFAEKFISALKDEEINWFLIFAPIVQVVGFGCWAGWVIERIDSGQLTGLSGSLRLWAIFGLVLFASAKSLYEVADDEFEADRRAWERSRIRDVLSDSVSGMANVLSHGLNAFRK